ncbi:MAG: hypothetical protein Q4P15_03645 [Propionibacteriaceae bacterium]|nr:hypothetical protein [Propionibacteriaceae bacterium]
MTAPQIHACFTSAGALQRLDAGALSVIQYPGSELEAGPHQVWLRRRSTSGPHVALGLLGPASGATIVSSDGAPSLSGTQEGLDWHLSWEQPADGMFGWSLRITNGGPGQVDVDAVCTLDVALTPWDDLRRNELYVSQYLDLTPLDDAGSVILAVRQNMPGTRTPWLALTCTHPVAGWCTDALQLAANDGTGLHMGSDLPSERLQHEHTLAGLQSEPITLMPGASATVGFRVLVVEDHAAASGPADVQMVRRRLAEADWSGESAVSRSGDSVTPTLFGHPEWLHGEALETSEFLSITGVPAELVENDPGGKPWAYRVGPAHVVAAAKEIAVLRPHGHILVAGEGAGPHDPAAAVTVWMNGTLASQLTKGHADAEPLLSVRRSYLGLTQAEGVRFFADTGEGWRLVGLPSAWSVTAGAASWWWRWQGRTITATTTLTPTELSVDVRVDGAPVPLMLAARTDVESLATGDAPLHADGSERETGWLIRRSDDGTLQLRIPLPGGTETSETSLVAHAPHLDGVPEAQRLADFLPWLAQDAVIHYQVPRGLEQFTGGAWGTRDVCQGPIGLLVAAGRLDLVEEVLQVVFSAQQDDGDWPQWFEYLPERRAPGHRESHGDVVYWPLLALGEHILMSGDPSILDVEAGWVGSDTLLRPTPIRDHVLAAVAHIESRRAHDSRLPAYGHGDWNDSLQPADPDIAGFMCSTWTAELEIKAFSTLAAALGETDRELAEQLRAVAGRTEEAVRELLLRDGELAGYAIVSEGGVELLVHPSDHRTGLTHGSLQMIHALADELLTPQEARDHVAIIDEHLDGPAGIYLFDTPVAYHGGETHMFLRAEAATFWGREIGLMYTHAHLRWVEALLRLGEAERAWRALQLVVPQTLGDTVPGAAPRQSNCYYSSVDARFSDRYDAEARAAQLFNPAFDFEGGWRVYSSGPGLILRLVSERFLGLRWRASGLVVDPVLPVGLDGLMATVVLGGRQVRVRYTIRASGARVTSVRIGGRDVPTTDESARYRPGGVIIPIQVWEEAMVEPDGLCEMEVDLG